MTFNPGYLLKSFLLYKKAIWHLAVLANLVFWSIWARIDFFLFRIAQILTVSVPLAWCFLRKWEKIICTYSGPKYCDASGAADWKTSNKSPTYIGHIGKHFRNKLNQKPPVAFTRIPGKVGVYPPDFVKSLNNDGRYLLNISHAVQNGVVPENLAVKIIGHTNKARYFHCKVLWSRTYWV